MPGRDAVSTCRTSAGHLHLVEVPQRDARPLPYREQPFVDLKRITKNKNVIARHGAHWGGAHPVYGMNGDGVVEII